MVVYFLVNGNIYNHALPKGQFNGINAITPEPPTTYIAESYQNAYETAFEAEQNSELNLYPSSGISSSNLPKEFINGTFEYTEAYGGAGIYYLIDPINNYVEQPCLFISTGSGGGNGYMYLDWIITTFRVPYEVAVP